GEVGHQVQAAVVGLHAIGEPVGGDLHPFVDDVSQAVDLADPEGVGHETADLTVVGVVQVDDGASGPSVLSQALQLQLGDRSGGRPGDVARHGGFAEHGGDVVVAGHDPAPQQV